MIDDETNDRAEIHDLFSRYADAVTGRQWELLDEHTAKTHMLGNYTASIDGDVAEASVQVRVYRVSIEGAGRQYQKIFGSFRARLIRTAKGWRFRHFGRSRSGIVELEQV